MNRFTHSTRAAAGTGLLAATLALSLAPGLASAQPLLSTREMLALPPHAADQVVRRDLLSVLTPISHRLSTGMMRRLQGVLLSVRPYGTRFPGLCRQDSLELKYAPEQAGTEVGDEHLQPYGLESSAAYHAVSLPKPAQNDYRREGYIWRSDCDALAGNENAVWFGAPDETQAARGLNFLAAAAEAVRAGTLQPTKCDLPPVEHRACRDVILAEGGIENVNEVEPCDAETGFTCFRITLDGYLQFEITGTIGEDDWAAPTKVTAIKVGYFVVVT